MAVLNVIVKTAGVVASNLNLKVGREKFVVQTDVQMEFLAKGGQFKEERFLKQTFNIFPSSSVDICQVRRQEVASRVNLNWMSDVVLGN